MVGGAWAAAGLNSKQKKEVTKIAKKYAGKPGAPGATGAPGSPGANGKDGSNGAPGAAGKSVVTSVAAVPSECPTGTTGTKFQVEGSATSSHVCNGKNGTTGFTETLPAGKTETGVWVAPEAPQESAIFVPLSFSIPLEDGAISEANTHFILEGETLPQGCSGEPKAPEAEPGNLCIFANGSTFGVEGTLIGNANDSPPSAVGGPGAIMWFLVSSTESGGGSGSWAVTAPTG